MDPNGYCWKHCFRVSCDQLSKSCTTEKHVHKDEATCNNTMGGFRWNNHHKFECHRPEKKAGYINLIHKKSSYYINCIPNIVYPLSRNYIISDSGTMGHYLTSKTTCVYKQVHSVPYLSTCPMEKSSTPHIQHYYQTRTSHWKQKICHIFPGINKYLTYIGVLCNHGRIDHFDENKGIITNKTTNGFLMKGESI